MYLYIHRLAPKYLCSDVIMHSDIHGNDTWSSEIWIYACPVSSKTITRKVLVIWLAIYGMSYLLVFKNMPLLIHLNNIISILKIGSTNKHQSYMCYGFVYIHIYVS